MSLPIEDIDSLVIDSYGVTVTAKLLTELAAASTTVVICDDKHMPANVLLPYSQHSRAAKVARQQLAMSHPLKKQLWQLIVKQKIHNQADVLSKHGLDDHLLRAYADTVRSGDSTNRESLAARVYFSQLLDDATRRKPIWHNAALNYGYAMVRSHIARHIAARGLVASQGVFHRNELNSFNLADDIIEPFRPIVDDYVLSDVTPHHIGDPDANLSLADRQLLVDILNTEARIGAKIYTLKHAVDYTVESFVQSVESSDAALLKLPVLSCRVKPI